MTETLMTFPCDFPLKIIGKATSEFFNDIKTMILHHYPDTRETAIKTQFSEHANYQSISVTVHTLNQSSLDALYKDLTQHPDVQMVL